MFSITFCKPVVGKLIHVVNGYPTHAGERLLRKREIPLGCDA